MTYLKLSIIAALITCSLHCCKKTVNDKLIGVKIYELNEPAESIINQWTDIGINTAFVSEEIAGNNSFMTLAKTNQVDVFIICPIYFNPAMLKEDSSLYAITNEGTIAKESWVEFVCPTQFEYQSNILEKTKKLVLSTNPDGISIDFIRHFAFWELIDPDYPTDSLPESCFCNHCLQRFLSDTKSSFPNDLKGTSGKATFIRENLRQKWTQWKMTQISKFVEHFTTELRHIKPDLKFNLHAVPWRSNDYEGAGKNIIGQDLKSLSGLVDYISPMCYSFMLRRPPEWIGLLVNDFARQGATSILPSIQVKECYRTEKLEMEEFKKCLTESLNMPSKGVIFWSWDYLKQEPDKLEVIKHFLKNATNM